MTASPLHLKSLKIMADRMIEQVRERGAETTRKLQELARVSWLEC